MAGTKKTSQDIIRGDGSGLKAVRKLTPAKALDETKNDSANAPVTPVDVDVAIGPRDASMGKPPIPEPRAGGKARSTVTASLPQSQGNAEIALEVETEAAVPKLLSDPQPGLVAAAVDAVMPPEEEKEVRRPEIRLREIKRYTDLGEPDMVPLSRKVSQVIWAFELVDAMTEASVVGKTRIFAVLNGGEEDIELTTFSSRSGRLVVRTRTTLENDVPATGLVPITGGVLNQDHVVELRFENDLYDPIAIAKEKFSAPVVLSPAPSYPFPSVHDPNGRMALILGQVPAAFDTGAIAKMTEGAVGGESLVDRQRRFALWGAAEKISGGKLSFDVKLEISDAPSSSRKLTLTYQATREKFNDDVDQMPGANNTDRMKLTELILTPADPPLIQAKDVPPVYLLLN
jgi:hypothetical protein